MDLVNVVLDTDSNLCVALHYLLKSSICPLRNIIELIISSRGSCENI